MGFSSIWFTDHVIGLKAFQPRFDANWMELLSSLSYAAARTSSIRLGSGVMVVPYRNPVYAAKVLATIDQLSDGRLNVGVGVGWARSEYKALGAGALFDERGAYTNEALDVMFECWKGGVLGYAGRWTKFREIEFTPTSVQRPHPAIWVGGHSGAALRRAARFADVWHPMAMPAEEYAATAAALDAMSDRKIRRTVRILVKASVDMGQLADQVQEFGEVGCDEIAVDLETGDADEYRASVKRMSAALQASSAAS
jgi:probable F420-dependent oxidoreductase